MKILRSCSFFYSLLTIALVLSGYALLQKDIAAIPDERAGPNLVIYFAEKSDTRRPE